MRAGTLAVGACNMYGLVLTMRMTEMLIQLMGILLAQLANTMPCIKKKLLTAIL